MSARKMCNYNVQSGVKPPIANWPKAVKHRQSQALANK